MAINGKTKKVEFGSRSRSKLIQGVDILANAVRITLGPKGRNVVLQRTWGAPAITKDGVTVAKEILLKDVLVRGFNIGTNIGKTAGQSVLHCHIHLIPRREGDVENPQGGVRSVIPSKQHYKRKV